MYYVINGGENVGFRLQGILPYACKFTACLAFLFQTYFLMLPFMFCSNIYHMNFHFKELLILSLIVCAQ